MGDSCSFSFKEDEERSVAVEGYSEEEVERERQRNYLVGIAVGHERDAAFLLEKAKEFFGVEKDDMAKMLRALSEKIRVMAEDERIEAKKYE